MSVRVVWDDPGVVRFEETEDEPDYAEVFPTFTAARASAIASCVDNAYVWQSCAADLRRMTKAEALP